MKTVPFLLILSLAAVAAGQDSPPREWKPFAPPSGRFTVLMPGSPIEQKEKAKTSTGEVEVTLFVLELKGEGTFAVGYSELPPAAARSGLEQRRLDNARDGVIATSKGRLLSERPLPLKKFPGRELQIQAQDETRIRTRLYAVRNRLYQLMAVGPAAWTESREAIRFLESFRLTTK
ncbi:MAG: hypothetical protein L0Z62_22755 [Gemmataceae bacterium]|nr:hypothetical protein [Gemmataceae bacterium]